MKTNRRVTIFDRRGKSAAQFFFCFFWENFQEFFKFKQNQKLDLVKFSCK